MKRNAKLKQENKVNSAVISTLASMFFKECKSWKTLSIQHKRM